jgi:RNA polymerase sigma factor (sigma-70 family)
VVTLHGFFARICKIFRSVPIHPSRSIMEKRLNLDTLESLFLDHRSEFKAMLRQRGGQNKTSFDPSDVVQDAYFDLRRIQSKQDVSTIRNPIGWLKKLVWRRFTKLARFHTAKKRDKKMEDKSMGLSASIPSSQQSPSTILVRRETTDQLQRHVLRLDHEDQEILFLRLVLDLSNNEIAQRLSMSPSGTSARFTRAVMRLTELMNTQ